MNKESGKLRTTAIRIRVTAEERLAIDEAALCVGLGPCTFARMATVKAAGRKPAPPGRRKADRHAIALAKWTASIGTIGGLLNQLARDKNKGFDVDPVDVAEVRDQLAVLRELVLAYDPDEPE